MPRNPIDDYEAAVYSADAKSIPAAMTILGIAVIGMAIAVAILAAQDIIPRLF